MTTIRPNLPPPLPSAAQKPADAGRLAAQKAFFAIAAGSAAAPAQAVQTARPAAPAAAPAPVNRIAQAPAEAPARPLRPGSLLDIRV